MKATLNKTKQGTRYTKFFFFLFYNIHFESIQKPQQFISYINYIAPILFKN